MAEAHGRLAGLVVGVVCAALLAWMVAPRLVGTRPRQLELFEPDAAEVAEAVAGAEPLPSLTGLARVRLTEEQAGRIFSLDQPHAQYDPHTWFAYRPDLDLSRPWPDGSGRWPLRTNSLGMREDAEPATARPDLRVLVAGDSHTDGVCPNEQSFPNLTEAALAARFPGRAVEVLNAARGGYTLYQHLGTLERFAPLEPDVFVVAVYGGNDFGEALNLRNYFEQHTPRAGSKAYRERLDRATRAEPELFGQAILSVAYFAEFPPRAGRAVRACVDVLREIAARCERDGVELVVVYLPSVVAARPGDVPDLDELLGALELDRGALASEDAMADELLARARELGATVVDVRADFAAAAEPLYWAGEWHVNPAAHALVARRLEPVLAERLGPR